MLYTIARLGRNVGSETFLGTLINKCRQVVQKNLPQSNKYNKINPITDNLSNSLNSTQQKQITNVNATNVPIIITNNSHGSCRSDNVRHFMISNTTKAAKTIEEQVGLPPKPKKPLTPYFRFMIEERSKIVAANPQIKIPDVVRQVSKNWSIVDPKIKQRLNDEFKRDQEKYIENRAKYDAKITEEHREKIKELKLQLKEAKEKQLMRKKIKDLGRPKRPATSFLRFIAKERTVTPQLPQQNYSEWRQQAVLKWNRLSEAEKNHYIEAARKDYETYQKILKTWEQQMIKLGNMDVVRNTTLIDPREPKPKPKKT